MTTNRGRVAPLLFLFLVLALSGCSGGSSGAGSASKSSGTADSLAAVNEPASDSGATVSRLATGEKATALVRERAVVSTGSLQLTTKDVGAVRAQVIALVRGYDGVVADERSNADRKGKVGFTELTLRIPSKDFDSAMTRLGRLATVQDSGRTAKDVTTEVIDVETRIHAQEVGLARLEQLMTKATSLGNLLAVEKQVTDRQAELDSLKSQQAYLTDQTSLSTISVQIDHRAATKHAQAHGGFLGGLSSGWDALVSLGAGVLRVTGALLPFAVVALVLWLPIRALVRAVMKRRTVAVQPIG